MKLFGFFNRSAKSNIFENEMKELMNLSYQIRNYAGRNSEAKTAIHLLARNVFNDPNPSPELLIATTTAITAITRSLEVVIPHDRIVFDKIYTCSQSVWNKAQAIKARQPSEWRPTFPRAFKPR